MVAYNNKHSVVAAVPPVGEMGVTIFSSNNNKWHNSSSSNSNKDKVR